KRVIEIAPIPPNVHVFIDGEDKGMLSDGKYEVTEGAHKVLLQNPACFDLPTSVDPSAQQKYLLHLKWKPAKLTINATPENADIEIGGTVGASGQANNVTIGTDSED